MPSERSPGRTSCRRLEQALESLQTWLLYELNAPLARRAALTAAATAAGLPEPAAAASDAELLAHIGVLASRAPAQAATVEEAALRAYVRSVGDPYTTWLSARERATLRAQLEGGSFVGIGVEVAPHPAGLEVVAALDGLPAHRAGLRVGDLITAVGQRSLRGVDYQAAADALLGPAGQPVHLVLMRAQQAAQLDVQRSALTMPPLQARALEGRVGYLRIPIFGPQTAAQAWGALLGLLRGGCRAFIIDLRGNPGGDLAAALSLASALVPGKVLVRVAHRGRPSEVRVAPGQAQPSPPELLLLVDRGTASSAEVFAAALADNRRATLAGSRTFGKGVIQTVVPLEDGSCLKITSGRYQTPGGKEVDHVGLQPTLPLCAPAGTPLEGERAVEAAARWLRAHRPPSP